MCHGVRSAWKLEDMRIVFDAYTDINESIPWCDDDLRNWQVTVKDRQRRTAHETPLQYTYHLPVRITYRWQACQCSHSQMLLCLI